MRPTLVDLCSLYQCATRKHSYEAWFRPLRAQDDLDASRGELRKVEAALEQVEFEKSMAQRGANAMLGLSVMLLASVSASGRGASALRRSLRERFGGAAAGAQPE